MEQYISLNALVAQIEKELNITKKYSTEYVNGKKYALKKILSFIDTLEVKECEAKSGIVQKDLQIILDDGTYIDLDPSMQLKPSFSVKEGEKVKVVISEED